MSGFIKEFWNRLFTQTHKYIDTLGMANYKAKVLKVRSLIKIVIAIILSSWWPYTMFQVGVLRTSTILGGAVDSRADEKDYKLSSLYNHFGMSHFC